MPDLFYEDKLYPFQDDILKIIEKANVDFYLTGGTALSRCYLNHRYSDDLDLFVNNHLKFKDQTKKVISLFKNMRLTCTVSTTSNNFVRILLERDDVTLKMDFVNDVPFHYGGIKRNVIFNKIDNWRNILSNKICALSRLEPKDIVDILFIAKRYEFKWEDIIQEAREKDLWAEPIEVCKAINDFQTESLKAIKWTSNVDIDKLGKMIRPLHDDVFYGNINSLILKEIR